MESILARYVATLQPHAIPASVKSALGRLWLDTVSVALAGCLDPQCRRSARTLAEWSGSGPCSVIGETGRVPPASAAFANGVFTHWYDWDDTHDDSHVHASAVIFPALIAALECSARGNGRASAGEFVAASVAAFDVACRVGGFLKKLSHRGWMPTGSGGTIGAAAGAARLMGLDENGILSAMGIAASGVGLSRQALADRVNGKNILAGLAAKNAVEAALLASGGVAGAPNFLTGIYGLAALYGSSTAELADLSAGLGRRFAVCEVSTKPYPSCRSTHGALDLVFDLLAQAPQAAAGIKAAELEVPQGVFERCGKPFAPGDNPRISAQFSLPFTVSLALRKGQVTPSDFESGRVLSFFAECADLIRAVAVRATPSAAGAEDVQLPVIARFVMSDGSIVEKVATRMKGSPDKPASREDAREKLALAVGNRLTVQQQAEVVAASERLHETGPHEVLGMLERALQRDEPRSTDTRSPAATG